MSRTPQYTRAGSTPRDSRIAGQDVPVDPILLFTILVLIAGGLVVMFSASVHAGTIQHGDPLFYLKRNTIYAMLGIGVMWAVSWLPQSRLQGSVIWLVLLALASMVSVLYLGHTVGRSRRWFDMGFFMVQPAEFAKVALVIYLAHIAHTKAGQMRSILRGYLPPMVIAGILMLAALQEPDFGTTVILAIIVVTMLFVAGTRLAYVMLTLVLLIPAAGWLVYRNTMRWRRMITFLDPWSSRYGGGYTTINALAALASGGVFGVGLGEGRQKFGYIPEAQTDFIVPVIGEELGIVGTGILLALYMVIAWRGLRAARRCPTVFGQALGFGIVLLLSVQVMINVAVAYALLPTKGLTLPLVSYGGTSMVMTCASLGLLLGLTRISTVEQPRRKSRRTTGNSGAVPKNLARDTSGGLS